MTFRFQTNKSGTPNAFTVIAGVHFLPLPGSPGYDRGNGLDDIFEKAKIDTQILIDNNVDALLFTNEADIPYLQELGPETVSAFATLVQQLMDGVDIPFGINALLDPVASIAIAYATGADFVRGYFAGGYVTDVGIMDTNGPEALRLRANLQAQEKISIYHNLVCAFGSSLVERKIHEETYGARVHVGVDGFTISGLAAGFAPSSDQFAKVRRSAEDLPIIVGTGITLENIDEFIQVADGAIVVTCLREDQKTLNRVDPVLVREFMSHVKRL